MTREIKFRGKLIKNDEWVFGDLVHDTRGNSYVYPEDAEALYITNRVHPETVCQYAGVKDKNGQEIYEGDILRSDEYPYHSDGEDNYLGVVFFADDDHMWEVMKFVTAQSKRSGISNFNNDEFYWINFSQMEVVGNLWDNKGLFRDSDEDIMKWFIG